MSELILLCHPEEVEETRSMGYRCACAAWRVGDDGRLWRSAVPKLLHGSMMAVFGGEGSSLLGGDIEGECARLGLRDVLWLASGNAPAEKGYRLYRPLSTAISGGSIETYLLGAKTVLVEPVRHYFSLPEPKGAGVPISEKQLEEFMKVSGSGMFSRQLGCKYLLWEDGCVLYDDAESIGRKVVLLRNLGAELIILPYMSGRIREFLRLRN